MCCHTSANHGGLCDAATEIQKRNLQFFASKISGWYLGRQISCCKVVPQYLITLHNNYQLFLTSYLALQESAKEVIIFSAVPSQLTSDSITSHLFWMQRVVVVLNTIVIPGDAR